MRPWRRLTTRAAANRLDPLFSEPVVPASRLLASSCRRLGRCCAPRNLRANAAPVTGASRPGQPRSGAPSPRCPSLNCVATHPCPSLTVSDRFPRISMRGRSLPVVCVVCCGSRLAPEKVLDQPPGRSVLTACSANAECVGASLLAPSIPRSRRCRCHVEEKKLHSECWRPDNVPQIPDLASAGHPVAYTPIPPSGPRLFRLPSALVGICSRAPEP